MRALIGVARRQRAPRLMGAGRDHAEGTLATGSVKRGLQGLCPRTPKTARQVVRSGASARAPLVRGHAMSRTASNARRKTVACRRRTFPPTAGSPRRGRQPGEATCGMSERERRVPSARSRSASTPRSRTISTRTSSSSSRTVNSRIFCRKPSIFRSHDTLPGQVYFTEFLRLQRELIKLQDWVVAKKLKLVVIFEGRNSAGKGGAIKRVTQRLNPRVCRAVALPAPTERESTQWYFQRYVPHLPAGGEIVLFDRSWYNRAGVERVMGFCTDEEYEDFFQSVPEFERLLVRVRHRAGQILVLDHRRRAAPALPHAHQRSAQAVEALADGPRVAPTMGSSTPRPRRRCSSAPIFPRRRGGWSRRSTRNAPASTASPIS